MKSPNDLLSDARDRLTQAIREFEAPPSSNHAKEFHELRAQAAVFNYDVSYDIVALWKNAPTGFAEKVALKGLVQKIFEYDLAMKRHLVRRLLALAKARKVEITIDEIKVERAKWKLELARLASWSEVRNRATAHYHYEIPEQLRLLSELDRDEVMDVVKAFLSYNIFVLRDLARVGKGEPDA